MGGLAGSRRQVQADMRTHLIHRPARDTIPPAGWSSSFLLLRLMLGGCHAATASLVHLNSLPSTQMPCKQVIHSVDNTADPVPGLATKLGGARSLLAVPILNHDTLIGAILIYRQEVRPTHWRGLIFSRCNILTARRAAARLLTTQRIEHAGRLAV